MTRKFAIIARAARRAFEGEDGAQPAGGTVQTPPPAPQPEPQVRTFSQKELDTIVQTRIAEVKKSATEANKKTVEQLQQLQQNQQLSTQEKEELQVRIDELQATYRTAEETKKQEIDKLTDKYTKETKKLTDERDTWRRNFETNLIQTAITRAASKYDAVSPEQIEAFLTPRTRVAEDLQDGKPNGKFIDRVKFEDVNAEGEPVVLELSTDAAVKLMRERANRFGNLFKNTTNGGTGTTINPNPGSAPSLDVSRMSVDAYRKNRAAIHEKMRAAKAG